MIKSLLDRYPMKQDVNRRDTWIVAVPVVRNEGQVNLVITEVIPELTRHYLKTLQGPPNFKVTTEVHTSAPLSHSETQGYVATITVQGGKTKATYLLVSKTGQRPRVAAVGTSRGLLPA